MKSKSLGKGQMYRLDFRGGGKRQAWLVFSLTCLIMFTCPAVSSLWAAEGEIRFRTVTCADTQGIGGEVFRMLVPSDWKCRGGIQWNLSSPTLPAVVSLKVSSPSETEELELFANSAFFWAERGAPRQTHPIGSRYFGREVLPTMDAAAYVQKVLIPRFRGNLYGLRVVQVKPIPSLVQMYQARCIPFASADGAKMKIEYQAGGRWMEEDIYTLVYYWNIPVKVWGVTSYFTNWGTDFQFSFKSPKGKMDAHAKVFKTMVKSFRPNLKWYNRYQQLVTMLIQRQVQSIRSIGELGSYIAKTGSQIRDENLKSWEGRQAIKDRLVKDFCHHIRGVEEYHDPVKGGPVELPAGYNNAWVNGLGEYIVSDSPSYNPNIGSNLHWQSMNRTR